MKKIKLISFLLALMMLLSACGQPNEKEVDNDNINEEDKAEGDSASDGGTKKDDNQMDDNRYINSTPGYLQIYPEYGWGANVTPDVYPSGYEYETLDSYLMKKDNLNFDYNCWLSWEQFSALGVFNKAYWDKESPSKGCFEYLYETNAGVSWIYYVDFIKIPEESKVTNIKEYYQWYLGREWDLTIESNSNLNRKMVVNTPTIASNEFHNSNLTNIDPNDLIFDNCKNQFEDFGYYVDDILELGYYSSIANFVSSPSFVYNGWLIKIIKRSTKDDSLIYALDDTDPEILQKLVNANTYKEAIAELMDPANGKYND